MLDQASDIDSLHRLTGDDEKMMSFKSEGCNIVGARLMLLLEDAIPDTDTPEPVSNRLVLFG